MDPKVYFEELKAKKQNETIESLKDFYELCLEHIETALSIGQTYQVKKISFMISALEREIPLQDLGITQWIDRDDISQFIKEVKGKVIKLIDLEDYERNIPPEAVKKLKILQAAKAFDKYFILYTDYTKNTEERIKKEKDPILFGAFVSEDKSIGTYNRFYFIADWEDEHCDLTLEKMLNVMNRDGKVINRPVGLADVTKKAVENYLSQLRTEQDNKKSMFRLAQANEQKPSFFEKVKTWIGI